VNDPDPIDPLTTGDEEGEDTALGGGMFVEFPVFGGAMLTHPDDE
jgi:hypothetical protein